MTRKAKRTCVVILTWNRLPVLKKTLKDFFDYSGEDHDILFLDNGSIDGTTEWLRSKKYEVLRMKENLGVFDGTMTAWKEVHQRGYDFILNLQDDFPSIATVPVKTIEEFLDHENDVGFVRLNDKKDQPKNIVTSEPIVMGPKLKVGNYKFRKYNYHATFNPCMIKAWLVPIFYTNQSKHRERGLMEKFAKTRLLAARVYPSMFKTLPQRPRFSGWKN